MFRRGKTWWTWARDAMGAQRRVSLGTPREEVAHKIDGFLRDLAERGDRQGVAAAVVVGEVSAMTAYSLGEAETARQLTAARQRLADQPIDAALLDRWAAWVTERRSERLAHDYRRQVEALGFTRQSELDAATITERLDALRVAEATKGRYRAAMASLCHWLVRTRWMATDPMPSVHGYEASKPRDLYYTREEAERLLAALPQPNRALETILYATGAEWGAIPRLTVADVDLDGLTVFAKGSKNPTRRRLTVFTEPHLVEWVRPVLARKLPSALVFPGLRGDTVLKQHQRACRAIGLPVTTLHDWRHSFSVKELQAGVAPQVVAQMLGHANAQLVITRYGRWVLTPEEIRRRAKERRDVAVAAR